MGKVDYVGLCGEQESGEEGYLAVGKVDFWIAIAIAHRLYSWMGRHCG